jgi:ribulose 1,5-bisphosphate carboxylase large subunit-like protein
MSIVNGKLDSVLALIREATESKIKGVQIRRTLKACRTLGLNESEIGSVLKTLEMDHFTNLVDGVWYVKNGTGLK